MAQGPADPEREAGAQQRTAPQELMAAFQPEGMAWAPDRPDVLELLARSRHLDTRSIVYGSNACFLIVLEDVSAGRSLAVYKPARGEYPLWDFPEGTLHRREVASFEVDRLLGWRLVPPTVLGRGRHGPGSIQLFVEESEAGGQVPVSSLRRLALLDWILNNADRKADHILVSTSGQLLGIDHGLTFHVQPKLRTILWHFAGERIDDSDLDDLRRLRALLQGPSSRRVHHLLDPLEWKALLRRIDGLVAGEVFPDPAHKAIPYRW